MRRLFGTDPAGEAALLALAVACLPYYAVTHPVKTYRLLVYRVGWYS